MKNFVTVNQKAFSEIAKKTGIKIDAVDAIIFRYLFDFSNSNKTVKRLIGNKIYFWISYKKIIDDNPLLNINNKEIIGRRINKLIKIGLLDKHLSKTDGNKVFLNITDFAFSAIIEGDEISDTLCTQKSVPTYSKVGTLPTQKSDNR